METTLGSLFRPLVCARKPALLVCPRFLFPIVALLAVLAAFFASPRLRGQTAGGTVEGRVFNAATGSALINARVTVEGTGREAITDEGGSFRITGVPAGSARINVSYLGMAPQNATVNVPAGGSARQDFDLVLANTARPAAVGETVKLDAFTIVADREMSA